MMKKKLSYYVQSANKNMRIIFFLKYCNLRYENYRAVEHQNTYKNNNKNAKI